MHFIILSALVATAFCQLNFLGSDVTGTTPPAVPCPNSLCTGQVDGNYAYSSPNYFLQCIGGMAYCQACWPLSLEYSPRCNQCLYSRNDDCVTTERWEPATTFFCPDICPERGYEFDGNIVDTSNSQQYVACWKGMTVGCIACPAGLQFNEEYNACLYEGRYVTAPNADSSIGGGNPVAPTARPTARPTTRPTATQSTRVYLNINNLG